MEDQSAESTNERVLYDTQEHLFIRPVQGESGVTITNALTGHTYGTTIAAELESDRYQVVSESVVEAPGEYIEELLHEAVCAVNGGGEGFRQKFDPVDVDYAQQRTAVTADSDSTHV